ncbi:MAG: carbohydrate ABC transporter permease [Clostridia bacterium]|nr:carbohydrate ABC transporter permease [Clostridia bacterium]
MAIKESKSRKAFNIFNICFMLFLIIITAYPLYYVLIASISDSNELMRETGLLLLPKKMNFAAYASVFKNPNILRGYKNTLIILVLGVSVNMVLTSMTAYALSRKGAMFTNAITMFIIFTMFFGGGLIPTYLLVNNLGITNTYWAVVLPCAMSAYNFIIMRTGFTAIPESIEEAARIDGAGHFTIFLKIFLPLSKATVAVILLYYCVGHWNSWFSAMIYMQKARELQPLQLVLRGILIANDTNSMAGGDAGVDREAIGESIKYAVIVVSTLPILILYPFLQKYFVQGVMIGAVKG